jgi:uncharacterized protein
MFEREFQQTPAALAGVDAGGYGDRARIVVYLDVMLVAYVQSFEILPHHHQIDVLEAAAGDEGASGAQIGVQLEFFAQAHVGGPVATARGGLERSLKGQARAADAVDGAGRKGVSRGLHAFQAGNLAIPLERRPERIEGRKRGIHDLVADPVSGDQRGGNRCLHRRISILELNASSDGGMNSQDEPIGQDQPIGPDEIVGATRRWLERSVIGLRLCPFAEPVYKSGRIRYRVSEHRSAAGLLGDLSSELTFLNEQQASALETTLLIHPWALTDFIEFNDFLSVCERLIVDLRLEGELQIASFHPQYRFAGTQPGDIENYTNRSPYPTLHLLREASIERALASVPDPDEIYRRNMLTMGTLGHEGWRKLWGD